MRSRNLLEQLVDTIKIGEDIVAHKDWSALDALLGERIRHRRHAQRISLKQLAERSGISIGLLSQIERGLSSPSLRVLASLADALKLGLADLFGNDPPEPSAKERIVVRADERKKLSFWRTGISKELLTPQVEDSTLDIFLVVLDPGGTTGSQLYAHTGEEGGVVLEGSIAIHVDGKEHRLRAGDGFRFQSTLRHSFWNVGPGTARVLWVNARPKTKKPVRKTLTLQRK
jgi:transcriptional regulator with XRE-family HTH domain